MYIIKILLIFIIIYIINYPKKKKNFNNIKCEIFVLICIEIRKMGKNKKIFR